MSLDREVFQFCVSVFVLWFSLQLVQVHPSLLPRNTLTSKSLPFSQPFSTFDNRINKLFFRFTMTATTLGEMLWPSILM